LPIYLSNITNAKTTRTADGGPYKRLDLKCQEFICETVPQNDFSNVYMPGHPDANSAGYVKFPRINIASEFAGLTNSAEELKLLASKQLCGSHAIVSSTSALIKYDPGTSVQSDTFTFTVDGKLSTWARTLRDGTLNQYAFNADGTLTDSGALRAAQPGAGSSSAANANVNGQPASGAASSSNVNAQPSSSSTTY
jgi:hypothetical protein